MLNLLKVGDSLVYVHKIYLQKFNFITEKIFEIFPFESELCKNCFILILFIQVIIVTFKQEKRTFIYFHTH